MAKILADKNIQKLIGTVLIDADESRINPNGIELRLGKYVRFHSTGEKRELEEGSFLKVNPGEALIISSFEKIDFSAETIQKLYPDQMLMGFITPTTTMMREGISQVSTKIDAGFKGNLNWGLRNSSTNELIVQYQEPIFKLTIFLLDEDESPELAYGKRENDNYQDTQGIKRSARRIPADIPKDKIIASRFDKLDPKKQLREAGYPFDHIGSELTTLHGRFEMVSKDVIALKDQFESQTKELGGKIDNETQALSEKIEETKENLIEKVEVLFDKKLFRIIGIIVGAIPVMYGGVVFMQGWDFSSSTIAFITFIAGAIILLLTFLSTRSEN